MPASWVRRTYDAVGVTQSPPGPHLEVLQGLLQGSALLCLDVSGSMAGRRLRAAVRGAEEFLAEARDAGYRVGLVLWHHDVATWVPPGAGAAPMSDALRRAVADGGTDLEPTLELAVRTLGPVPGDRVVCVVGDGDVGDARACARRAEEARALGIRFVVRGLGRSSAAALAAALTPGDDPDGAPLVHDVDGLSRGIASMARSLGRHRPPPG